MSNLWKTVQAQCERILSSNYRDINEDVATILDAYDALIAERDAHNLMIPYATPTNPSDRLVLFDEAMKYGVRMIRDAHQDFENFDSEAFKKWVECDARDAERDARGNTKP